MDPIVEDFSLLIQDCCVLHTVQCMGIDMCQTEIAGFTAASFIPKCSGIHSMPIYILNCGLRCYGGVSTVLTVPDYDAGF